MQVREPALSPPVSPLGAEHDEVVGPNRLDLPPRLPTAAGRIQGRRVLHDDALVSGAQRLVEHAACLVRGGREEARDFQFRCQRLEPGRALLERRVEEILAFHVQEVEEEGHDPFGWRIAIDPRHGFLECRRSVFTHPQRLAVEHGLFDRKSAHDLGDPGQRGRDVVQVARVDAHLVVAAMDLDADPVELPLDQCTLVARHCVAHALGGGREHRENRAEELEADLAQPLFTRRHGDLGGPGEVARQHQGPARDLARHAGSLRDRVRHHSGERTLAKLAGEEPLDEPRLVGRRSPEEVSEDLLPPRCRSAPRRLLDGGDRPVELGDRERRVLGRRTLHAVHHSVPDADAPLPRHAGQEADGDGNFAGLEFPQEVGQDRDLPRA